MAEERIYTIPLRDAYKAPRPVRSRKSIKYLKDYLKKHLKTEEFVIGPGLNHEIWSRGIKKPPRKVKVVVLKKDEKFVVELFGYKPKKKPKETAKKGKKKLMDKVREKSDDVKSGKVKKSKKPEKTDKKPKKEKSVKKPQDKKEEKKPSKKKETKEVKVKK